MEVNNLSSSKGKSSSANTGWEAEYFAYLAEKEAAKKGTDASSSPLLPYKSKEESWEAQYAAHCAEKEARLAEEDAARRLQELKLQEHQA